MNFIFELTIKYENNTSPLCLKVRPKKIRVEEWRQEVTCEIDLLPKMGIKRDFFRNC